MNTSTPDLTQHAPRSIRVRLGGFAHFPRLLDKARAFAAGKNGEYHFNCPIDRTFFDFTGIDHTALLAEVKRGLSDTEMLAWVRANTKRTVSEISAWSAWIEQYGPSDADGHTWIGDFIKKIAPSRDDIKSFAELLDVDDYVSFGGRA
jgi:hypothetical protein